MLERDCELETIGAAVDAAQAGRGGVLWIEGPAGIGKTSLVRAGRQHARRSGMRVLWTRPGPLEREFAFGAMRGLFEAAVAAQPEVLASGPARLAAPVVTLTEPAEQPAVTAERLHGLYWLTVGLADDAPLLLVVDDAHWIDEPSLQALAYLARRVEELPVAILLATRSDFAADAPDMLRDDLAGVVLRPAPLSRVAVAHLVHAELGEAAPDFLDGCQDATGGNPLLLKALLAALREDGVVPDDSGLTAVRHHARAIVGTFVLPRLRHLPPAAGRLARAVAVLGRDAQLRRAASLADLTQDTALDAAAALVAAELLAPGKGGAGRWAGTPLTFTHPLVAEAVTAHMSVAERHRGHLRAARCLAVGDADPERVAAHLLAVEPMADPWVVARLREAARAARGKGAPRSSVTYLQRALAEPPDATDLSELLGELGTAQLSAGDGAGYTTLRHAVAQAMDPPAAARVALALSRAARAGDSYRSGEDTILAAAAALGDTDPDLLADLHTELALANRIGAAPGWPTAARVKELADRAAARGDATTGRLLRLAALAALRDPASGAQAGPLAIRAATDLSHAAVPDAAALFGTCMVLVATDRLDTARDDIDAVLDTTRRSARLLDTGIAITLRAHVNYRLGRLRDAEEDARLADRLAIGFHRPDYRRQTQAWLAHCLVERVRLDEAEGGLADSAVAVTIAQLLMARARLRLAQHRPGEALADLDECGRRLVRRQVLHPNHLPWQPWSVVALASLGDDEQARARATTALTAAREFGSVRAEGLALWAFGLVDRDTDVLAAAVAALRRVPAPLERARALVDLGAALRRANRRCDARAPLGEGLQLAHECGADALVAVATTELAAIGVHPRRSAVTGPHALTPTERRIAERAAAGASNRDIAQALFITPKTVENHLGNAYRKLGVAGRGALATALGP